MEAVSCFQQCSLACHKKCLETLAIQCGHKKLQGRLQLFGIDFAHSARNSPDGIPFIIKKCTAEIESRALDIKVNHARGKLFSRCKKPHRYCDIRFLRDVPHYKICLARFDLRVSTV